MDNHYGIACFGSRQWFSGKFVLQRDGKSRCETSDNNLAGAARRARHAVEGGETLTIGLSYYSAILPRLRRPAVSQFVNLEDESSESEE